MKADIGVARVGNDTKLVIPGFKGGIKWCYAVFTKSLNSAGLRSETSCFTKCSCLCLIAKIVFFLAVVVPGVWQD